MLWRQLYHATIEPQTIQRCTIEMAVRSIRKGGRLSINQMNSVLLLMVSGAPVSEAAEILELPQKTVLSNYHYLLDEMFENNRFCIQVIVRLGCIMFVAGGDHQDAGTLQSGYRLFRYMDDGLSIEDCIKCVFESVSNLKPSDVACPLLPMLVADRFSTEPKAMQGVMVLGQVYNDPEGSISDAHFAEQAELNQFAYQLRELGACCWKRPGFYNFLNTLPLRHYFLRHLAQYRALRKNKRLHKLFRLSAIQSYMRFYRDRINRGEQEDLERVGLSSEKLKSQDFQRLLDDLILLDAHYTARSHGGSPVSSDWSSELAHYMPDLLSVAKGRHVNWDQPPE